jgi:hypothetical protein
MCDTTTFEQAKLSYLQQYPDVKDAGIDPWVHYTNFVVKGKERRIWNGPGPTKYSKPLGAPI